MPEASGTQGRQGFFSLHIPADLAELSKTRLLMEEIGQQAAFPQERIYDLQVCVSEAAANGIEHASSAVEIEAWILPDRVIVEVTNDGVFRPGFVKIGEARRRGLGLPLMVSLADHVHVSRLGTDKTKVSLTFFLAQTDLSKLSNGFLGTTSSTRDEGVGRGQTATSRFVQRWAWLPIPVLVILAVLFNALGPHQVHESQTIVSGFNALFVAGPLLVIAYLAARSYLVSGSAYLVSLGAGSLVMGIAFFLAGPLRPAPNVGAAVTNVAVLVGSACFLLSAIQNAGATRPIRGRRSTIIVAVYLAVVAFVGLLMAITFAGLMPAFTTAHGFTIVRQAVFGVGIATLFLAAGGFFRSFRRVRSPFLVWWYSGLVLLASGFVISLVSHSYGTPISWVSRGGEWVAGLYLLAGVLSLDRRHSGPFALERALEETEDRYRKLVDVNPDAVFVVAEGKVVFANPASALLLGTASPLDLLGREWLSLVSGDGRAAMTEASRVALAGSPVPPREVVLRRLDGDPLDAEASASRVEVEGRLAMQVVLRDITERKRAEDAVRESERRFRTLFDSLIEGFCTIEMIFDDADNPVDYRFLQINQAFEGLTGLHDAQGKRMRELAPDHDAYWFEIYGRVASTGEPARFQAPATALGHYYDVSAYRIGGPESRRVGILFNDITEQKQAEEALRESEERFRTMADAIPQLAWMATADGYIYWYNQRWYEYTGTTLAEMEGWGWQSVHDPRALPGVLKRWQASIATGEPFDMEFPLRGADGEFRMFLTRVMPQRDVAGQVIQWFGTNTDITEHKRAEQIMLRLNRTLAAHSASDQALIRATDESSYLAEVCRIVVEDCGHAMVWIGYKEHDDERSIRPVASAGFGEDYLETLNVTWADGERGRGPTGTAVRTGRPSKCPNMLTDPAFAPWRDEALRRGYASSVALPLQENGTTFGAITIYSSESNPFSDDEVKLLAELTNDLALGITTLRLRAARAEAEKERDILLAEEQHLTEELQAMNEELHAQTEELQLQTEELAAREEELQAQNEELRASRYNRTLIEASLDPLVTIGLDGTITDVNEAAVKIRGYPRGEIIGTDFSDYFTDPEKARLGYQEAFAMGSVTDYPLTIRARDGKLTDVLYNATVYREEGGEVQGVFAAARDVTALKDLEIQREIASELQGALLDIPEQIGGVKFGHLYRSATQQAQVGGDFYDVFEVKDGQIAVLIGDVCGHGIPAARTSTLVKDVIHAFIHQSLRTHQVLRRTNRLLVEKRLPGFVTVFLGILDQHTGHLRYCVAGHPDVLLRRASGTVEHLGAGAFPIGVYPDATWNQHEVDLGAGDTLVLYTDGVIEARVDGELFGEKRLEDVLKKGERVPPERLPQLILDQVLDFSQGTLRDDVAVLALSLSEIVGSGTKRPSVQEKLAGLPLATETILP